MVSVLCCQFGVKLPARSESWFKISAPPVRLCPLANSAMMNTLTNVNIHCQWENEMVREGTDHQPWYAEAKKLKSLTFHTHGSPRAGTYCLL